MTDSWERATTIGATPVSSQLVRQSPNVRIYRLLGVFTDGRGAYALLDRARRDLGDVTHTVIFDLTDVTHMTSCAVGILAAAYTSSLSAGCPMALVGMSPRVRSVMSVVGLLPVIPNYETLDEALSEIGDRS